MLEIGKRALFAKIFTLNPGAVQLRGEEYIIAFIGPHCHRFFFSTVREGDVYEPQKEKCGKSEEPEEPDSDEEPDERNPSLLGLG